MLLGSRPGLEILRLSLVRLEARIEIKSLLGYLILRSEFISYFDESYSVEIFMLGLLNTGFLLYDDDSIISEVLRN